MLLGLDETTSVAGAIPLWETLDATQRAEVVTILARLIARAAESEILATREAEPRDE
jgi:hypothetical protein